MSLFKPAEVTTAYLKMGIMGKQGAGKSMTAAKVAVGLIKYLKAKDVAYAGKPVAFFDTETGSDWLIPLFNTEGIPLVVAKKRSFADLLEATRWAEANASALIIDSVTHPWRELLESFMKKKQRSFLQIDDWSYLKGDHGWAQYTDLYVNSKLHIIMCGRAGDDMEQYTDENGKRQLEKVGVKMKTEGETGFEPSLLVLMEREFDTHTGKATHRAVVMKDRSTRLDGAHFDNPDFKDFLPHIELLRLGGQHVGVETGGDSQHILTLEKRDWQPVQREICIDEIQTILSLHYPSQSAEDKKNKLKALLKHFDATWTEMEKVMPLVALRAGYDSLYRELEGKPSRYATTAAEVIRGEYTVIENKVPGQQPTLAAEMNDAIPEFDAPAARDKLDRAIENMDKVN
jgi:AAA domain